MTSEIKKKGVSGFSCFENVLKMFKIIITKYSPKTAHWASSKKDLCRQIYSSTPNGASMLWATVRFARVVFVLPPIIWGLSVYDYLYKYFSSYPNYWKIFKISTVEKIHLSCKNSIITNYPNIMFIFCLINTYWELLYTSFVLGARYFGQTLTAWVETWDCEMIGRSMQDCKIYLIVKDPEIFGAGYL